MIAPMKKVYLVSLESARTETLAKLREIGVVHLSEVQGESEALDELTNTHTHLEHAMHYLPLDKTPHTAHAPAITRQETEEALEIAKRVEQQSEERARHVEGIDKLEKEIERVETLGEFNPNDIKLLREKGVNLQLFDLNKEEYASFPKDLTSFVVYSRKNGAVVATIVPEDSDLAEKYPLFELPEASISEMRRSIAEHSSEIKKIDEELKSLCEYGLLIQRAIEKISSDMEFERVKAGLQSEGSLIYLSGYVPEKYVQKLQNGAMENGWALLLESPGEEDPTPTMVENPKPVRIIKPVFNFLGTVPGYYEYDISFFFIAFLTVFFAMIVGDAGYGAILLGTAVYMSVKAKRQKGQITTMHGFMLVMGAATVMWGAVTGVWFGSITLAETPPFSLLVIDQIYGFGGEEQQQTIKLICFILGTLQLSIAHIWNFITEWKRNNKLRSIAQLGWLSMVLGLYYLVLYLVLDPQKYPIPEFSLYMVFAGLAAVMLFSEQEGNFIKGVLKGLANFMPKALDSISAFSDIISYIRLFAVGLATVEIAKSFNSMAADLGNSVLGIVGGIVILLIGHGLNMAMAALSVVVHGVRLNLLEFSGHLGMEWTGIPYEPFRDKLKKQ